MDIKILPNDDMKRQARELELEAALLSVKLAIANVKLASAEYKRYLEKNSERNDHQGKMAHD